MLIISLVFGYALRAMFFDKPVDESRFLYEVSPDTVFYDKKVDHYPSDRGVVAFNSYDLVPGIKGYAGPIKVLVALGPDGVITGIKILEHRETLNYVHAMLTPEFLKQFLGKGVNNPLQVDTDIDGVTRATVSVKALTASVRGASRLAGSKVLGLKVTGVQARPGFDFRTAAFAILFLAAMGFYFLTKKDRGARLKRARDVSMVLGLFVAGLWLSTPFSILHVFNLLLMRLPSSSLWYAVVGGTLLSIIFAGRFYCGWLCPFGALSEFIGRLTKSKWNISPGADQRWRRAKYVLLALAGVLVFVTGKVEFGSYETYVTLFSLHGGAIAWLLVVLCLAANLWVPRFWCRYLCPVAALTGALCRPAAGYPSSSECPMDNPPGPHISECIRCNRCYVRKP